MTSSHGSADEPIGVDQPVPDEPLTADPEPRWIDDPMGEALRIADQFPDGFIATLLKHFAALDAAADRQGLDEIPQQPEATGDAAEPPWQECGHVHCRTRLYEPATGEFEEV